MDQQNSYFHRALTVLHVEDNKVYHIGVKALLENISECKFTVHNAETLEVAINAVKENNYDIILLDLSLPDSHGLDTLRSMHKVVPHIPTVLFTGTDDENIVIEGIRIGAQDYLPKDYLKPDLIKRVIFAAIDRKTVEEALKHSEERFELAVRGSSVGLWDWDVLNNELYWSDKFKEIVGVTSKEFVPDFLFFKNLLHADDSERVQSALQNHIGKHSEYDIEYRLKHVKGHYVWIHARGQAVWDENGDAVRMAGSVDDITDKKKTESENISMELQLQHAQKLESIGRLAAGVAHEINTPTQFVGDNTRFLQNAFSDITNLLNIYKKLKDLIKLNSPAKELVNQELQDVETLMEDIDLDYLLDEIPGALDQALDGIERIGTIVKAMKEFSHPGSNKKELVDLNNAIENTITVSRNEWKYVAKINTDFDDELPMVECFPGEFNQTILNMIVNAAHAIEESQTDNGFIRITTKKCNSNCEITIQDNGPGIPKEIRNKIFDPFFTTKEVGKGTGQGLAISYSVIVDKHQGSIKVESEPGQGTSFVISMPIKSPCELVDEARGKSYAQEVTIC